MNEIFPVYATEPVTGIVHGFVDTTTLCGIQCGPWPIIVGGIWDCPECQVVMAKTWAAPSN